MKKRVRTERDRNFVAPIFAIALALGGCDARIEVEPERSDEIPITTSSAEARESFLAGRDLSDKIRGSEAREYFERAVELDPDFALAHLMLANTANSALEFFEALRRAVELAETVSDGERLLILAQDAGSRGDLTSQERYLSRLVELYPSDERARFLLAGYHFGRQEYEEAIKQYREATRLEPAFSAAYNLLGYAYRSAGRFEDAEAAFRRYIELIPDEPNPYDSYAELLMKLGRFEESIENYQKALDIDERFVASYVGIANNLILLDRGEKAREKLEQMIGVSRNVGERRQALFWIAASHLHEGDYPAAEAITREMMTLAEESEDWAQVAGDLVLIGDLLVESGDDGRAVALYDEALAAMERADVNDDVKDAFRRNRLYRLARLAAKARDLNRAAGLFDAYADAVASRNIPNEVRRVHELQGLVAMAEGDAQAAVEHLSQANQQDPRVLYELALALRRAGEDERAREAAITAAEWNQLGLNFAYVRERARRLANELA